MTKIETNDQYQWAINRIEELLPLSDDTTPANAPSLIELDLLSGLVSDYEDEHFPIEKPSLAEVLKLRMYEMGITQKALAKLLGVSSPRISEYLSGKSEPTLKIAREIGRKLGIDANIILGI